MGRDVRALVPDGPMPAVKLSVPGKVVIGPIPPVIHVVVIGGGPVPPFEPSPLPPGPGGGVRHIFDILSQLSITQITVMIPAIPAPAGPAPTVLPP